MNLNILSSGGRNPSLSANVTMPNPAGGTKTNRAKIIAAVVFSPSFELPGPALYQQQKSTFFNILIATSNDIQTLSSDYHFKRSV
ncbi:hypothetical protein HanIR_Chr10g0461351 [Helianthus annuus]|nr:hypothetical protein HanIR_Chr10g0461351 [Helianthus annuus]